MDLLKNIKQKRARQKQKKPIKGDVFNQISGLVRRFGLEESFLDALDAAEDYLPGRNLKSARIRVKEPVERPLFSLVTEAEYFLTVSIIQKADSPYLRFAHSPEEILLARPLYRLNPSLAAEKLTGYHFETLLLHERAKAYGRETLNQDGENG